MPVSLKGIITSNERILPDFYKMIIAVPQIANEATPGQFVMLRTSTGLDPFLKRPISLSGIDRDKGTITLIYHVVGRGTNLLTGLEKSAEIELVGPLGKGFGWNEEDRTTAVVGGGAGIAPLVALAEELIKQGKEVYALLGAQTKDKLLEVEAFAALGAKVRIATDDGSSGEKGFVTRLLEELSQETKIDKVFCCGPLPMTKAVVKMTKELFIPCEVSLEERMGCGFGACIGCACKVRDEYGTITYKKVCQDGPVFTSCEVIFE